ncbi:Actin-related protein 2/3 complex subunit 1B [Vitis vinifera]|uniref:Actin-related protein 2/3 complex subunit 1B n=1 Tax=Vitis vinifera TaxID=29760 RepID=A0A438DC27_VITVI|nr:Actin-related protein 2/3 complex subunit 1B [Vitis vinifera]
MIEEERYKEDMNPYNRGQECSFAHITVQIILLATTSTDGKCRVFSTFIKGVDTRDSRTGSSSDAKFGEVAYAQNMI